MKGRRHKHTLSNYQLLSCNMGKLVPVGLIETLPGDTFQISSSALIRVSPLAAPVMHPVDVRLHHFFVPHRLVWDGWEDFITGGPDGMNADTIPTRVVECASGANQGTIADYFGIPTDNTGATDVTISDLPFRGYNLIWNEWFRDQDLQTERSLSDATTADIGWGKDYFTTARPWTQKGPEITLPLGTDAPIRYNTNFGAGGSAADDQYSVAVEGSSGGAFHHNATIGGADTVNPTGSKANMYADLSQAGQITVNDFRRGFALQRYEEARARYGSRYTEYLRYLGVRPSDARLQRPELLGSARARLNFSEVLQTAEATNAERESYGVGDLYGHGIAGLRSRPARRFIEEHGYIFSLLSVRPKGIYMNGVPRTFLRSTKEDFWQKELEFIGQQEVWKDEIWADGSNGGQGNVWGYQDRYREYRENFSSVHGEFRTLLNYWHMARDLPPTTTLNDDFVKCVPTTRIYNVQDNDVLWCMVNNHVVARRLVSRSAYARIL